MSSASKRHGGRFLRRDAGYGDALKKIKLHEGFALHHANTLEDFPMHHFNQYSSIMGFLRTFNPKDACVAQGRLPRTTLLTPRALLAGWAASATALDRLQPETPRRCAARPVPIPPTECTTPGDVPILPDCEGRGSRPASLRVAHRARRVRRSAADMVTTRSGATTSSRPSSAREDVREE